MDQKGPQEKLDLWYVYDLNDVALNETLVKQPDIFVRDTLNYQNNYRNTFG